MKIKIDPDTLEPVDAGVADAERRLLAAVFMRAFIDAVNPDGDVERDEQKAAIEYISDPDNCALFGFEPSAVLSRLADCVDNPALVRTMTRQGVMF